MQILLAHGADPGLLDENGNTAQQIVTKYGHFEAAGIVPGSQVQSQRNPKSNITNKQAADPRAGGLIKQQQLQQQHVHLQQQHVHLQQQPVEVLYHQSHVGHIQMQHQLQMVKLL